MDKSTYAIGRGCSKHERAYAGGKEGQICAILVRMY